jgi:hypothetical protein
VKPKRRLFGGRTSILLALVVVVALVVAGLIGAELYVRHAAESKVASAVQCKVQDSASVSFARTPPMLWQYITSHYTDISVQSAGNQVREAKGMKVAIDIQNVQLNKTNNSKGTIGALNGTITWSSDGIKQSIRDVIPVLGKFVAVKPQIANNGLSLQVVSLSALGTRWSTNKVQKHLDDLTSKATQNFPLGIHANSVKVTNTGVEATFSTSNAAIPSQSQDPCFANL